MPGSVPPLTIPALTMPPPSRDTAGAETAADARKMAAKPEHDEAADSGTWCLLLFVAFCSEV